MTHIYHYWVGDKPVPFAVHSMRESRRWNLFCFRVSDGLRTDEPRRPNFEDYKQFLNESKISDIHNK